MKKLREVIRYLLINSSEPSKLTKTKVTKLVYLADWFSSLESQKQITGIEWFFDHYGPYVSDVYLEAERDPKINIKSGYNAFGNPKETLECTIERTKFKSRLNQEEKYILDKVLGCTDNMNWKEFINYVYETKPVKNSEKYSKLDLVSISVSISEGRKDD